jgi:two-component SAPR family response regulator
MPVRVLIVDDEQDITSVIKTGLEQRDFVVTAFNLPSKALENYKAGAYDIILLDIRMPAMTGFELARAIWNVDKTARICFLTSFEIYEEEAALVFPSMGRRCFLRKPMTAEHLAKHILTQMDLPAPGLTTT